MRDRDQPRVHELDDVTRMVVRFLHARTQPFGQEVFPGPLTHSDPLESQILAGPQAWQDEAPECARATGDQKG